MITLPLSSKSNLHLLQKSCEVLVVANLATLQHTYNISIRKKLIAENQQANEMIDQFRKIIKENK